MSIKSKHGVAVLLLAISGCIETPSRPAEQYAENQAKVITERTGRLQNYKATIDSINEALSWTSTDVGLWRSSNGDLAIKAMEGTDVGIIIDQYISNLNDGRPLAQVIDTTTFSFLGSSFYKDKNHIYTHYQQAGGGTFAIVDDADVNTFQIIGNCYAKDVNHIFGERSLKMESVDYKTFQTCDECGCYAKDKNGYYSWGRTIDVDKLEDEEALYMIEMLKKI
jgi:hypothetical protein